MKLWILLKMRSVEDLLKVPLRHHIQPVLEITVGHWPFSDQFQHLADQNQFWSAIFPVHFQWNSNQ